MPVRPLVALALAAFAIDAFAAAPPAAPQESDTASSAVVDDRSAPEDLPRRRPPAAGVRASTDNPLRRGPADSTAPAPAPVADEQGGSDEPAAQEGCGKQGCTSCQRKVPTCKAKWEDKKTKRPSFTMTCDWECVRPWEPYCQGRCCEEKTTPCGEVYAKKKLFKTDEDRCERVLKYELEMKPAGECCNPAPIRECLGCRILGETVHRLLSNCPH